jgi:hypothetical protein
MAEELSTLEQLLDRIGEARDERDEVSLGMIVETIGSRAFGPLLLMAGVVLFSPLSGIPGVPTFIGILVLLIGVQLLFGKEQFWYPQWLLKRSVARSKIGKALKWLRPPARLIDRVVKPRWKIFIRGTARYVIASICVLISLCMPVMELVPFSSAGAGAALSTFGLALVAEDGLLAIIAYGLTALTAGLAVYNLL